MEVGTYKGEKKTEIGQEGVILKPRTGLNCFFFSRFESVIYITEKRFKPDGNVKRIQIIQHASGTRCSCGFRATGSVLLEREVVWYNSTAYINPGTNHYIEDVAGMQVPYTW